MNFNVETKLYDKQAKRYICFTCAVKFVIEDKLIDIKIDSDEFGSDYDFRDTSCHVCGRLT